MIPFRHCIREPHGSAVKFEILAAAPNEFQVRYPDYDYIKMGVGPSVMYNREGFSMAGQRKKNDIRNTLSDSYIEFISIVKPKFLVFENVQGFTIGFKDENEKKGVPYSCLLYTSDAADE